MTTTTAEHLAVDSIGKRYGQTQALDGVTLKLVPGQVLALVGHNGAGKSTLLKMLAGAERPDEGAVLLDGVPQHFSTPADSLAAGIACVYQELRLVDQLTVAQNVFLGHETTRRGRLAQTEMNRRTAELCQEYGVTAAPTDRAGELSVAQRQMVEVVAALNRNARYLLLDEPTTALEAQQIDHLLATVKRISRERNMGILLVDHKLDEVFSVADHVIGLANGRVVLSGSAATVSRDDVVHAIVGESGTAADPPAHRTDRTDREGPEPDVVLDAVHVSTDRLKDVTLQVRAGEVLGLYGLVGSGRSRFLRTLYGAERPPLGALTLAGSPYRPKSPAGAIRSGIAFLSEERKADGFVPGMSARENVSLPVLHRFSRAGRLQRRRIARATHDALQEVAVRGDTEQPITRLSGGNQQKVLFARAALQQPRLLLLDEPTKGVDVGAKAEIHTLIRAMAADGQAAVIVVSTEEEELIGLADAVCVFKEGACDGTKYPRDTVTPGDLRRLAWPSGHLPEEPPD
ncbi:sugar ABC transporter ATP-binding protein [Streptomyces sp. MBT62]|uniref:sugar ABC transporter ATP-binding protein n=1 Tax=Streptomyces sp. MBT62 TaxID=2800410 RepID=UPI00190BF122|nr:sugar ABC transporter ATP-binding protein [Streptomyces sp. MBT62]MBK3564733.1 sugar ABC transporter ATP-binding protein [Streptomyces sp. MBT62]